MINISFLQFIILVLLCFFLFQNDLKKLILFIKDKFDSNQNLK